MSTLSKHEIKALAIELAAALPPAHREPRRQAVRSSPDEAHDALGRLCQAEQVLKTVSEWLRENGSSGTEWQASEALDGVLRLMDGIYATLGAALPDPGPAAQTG
jgi:hypothetical protein